MTEFEIIFQRDGVNHAPVPVGGDQVGVHRGVSLVRARLLDRSNYALQLGRPELLAFEGNAGAQGVIDVVNVLAPDAGDRASLQDFRALLVVLTTGGQALNGAQIVALVDRFDGSGVSGRQICRFLTLLVTGAGAMTPRQLGPLMDTWTGLAPRITVAQFSALCVALLADVAVTLALLLEVLTELKEGSHPNVVHRIHERFCTGEDALSAAQFCTLALQLRHPPARLGVMTPEQIDHLTTYLITAPAHAIRPLRVREMATAWIGEEPRRASPLYFYWIVRRMHEAAILPRDIGIFATTTEGNFEGRPARPAWLYTVATQHAEVFTTIRGAAAVVGGYARIANVVSKLAGFGYPERRANVLLSLVTRLTGNQAARIETFLTMAYPLARLATDGGWIVAFAGPRASLVASGRAPQGAHRPLAAPVATPLLPDGAAVRTVEHGLNSFVLYRRGLVHACNAHLFRHCDFDERDGRDAPYLTFWPGTYGEDQVITAFLTVPGEFLSQLVRNQGGGAYRSGVWAGRLDVGIRRLREEGGRFIWSVTHFMPAPSEDVATQIRKSGLRALSGLFD